jgi:hypothetical protein
MSDLSSFLRRKSGQSGCELKQRGSHLPDSAKCLCIASPGRFCFRREKLVTGHYLLGAGANSGGFRRVAVSAKSWEPDADEGPSFCVSLYIGVG